MKNAKTIFPETSQSLSLIRLHSHKRSFVKAILLEKVVDRVATAYHFGFGAQSFPFIFSDATHHKFLEGCD